MQKQQEVNFSHSIIQQPTAPPATEVTAPPEYHFGHDSDHRILVEQSYSEEFRQFPLSNTHKYHRNSQNVTCQHCHSQITTQIEYEKGCASWTFCLVTMPTCCCCCICCSKACSDVIHICPNCNRRVGRVVKCC